MCPYFQQSGGGSPRPSLLHLASLSVFSSSGPALSLRWVAFCMLLVQALLLALPANAEVVEPRYIARNNEGVYLNYQAALPLMLERYSAGTYASWFIPKGLVPTPNSTSTLNGKQFSYSLYLEPSPTNPNPNPGPSYWSTVHLDGECPVGFTKKEELVSNNPNFKTIFCERPDPCDCKEAKGNPIDVTGTKIQKEVDYTGIGALSFTREYRSTDGVWTHNFRTLGYESRNPAARDLFNSELPCVWGIGSVFGDQYCFPQIRAVTLRSIHVVQPGEEFIVKRPGQRMRVFGTGTTLAPAADVNDRAIRVLDASGATVEWQVFNASNDTTETFNLLGQMTKVTLRSGQQLVLAYADPVPDAAGVLRPGKLLNVTDSFQRQLKFSYDANDRLSSVTDPANGQITYAYDEASAITQAGSTPVGNLTSVTYQDGKRRIYWYNEPEHTAGKNFPAALTGITDEEGVQYATFKYDAVGRAISTEHAGGVAKYSFQFVSPTTTKVTDPLNVVRTYTSQFILNNSKDAGSSFTLNGTTYSVSRQFDANGNVTKSWDLKGVLSTHTFNAQRNLETSRTEGSYERTVSTEWHPIWRKPVRIAEPGRMSYFDYDPQGRLLGIKVRRTGDAWGSNGLNAAPVGAPREWRYTYNALGQILTVKGPRTDVLEQTSYEYGSDGNLATVSNALGHVTSLSNYEQHGRVGTVVAPDGVTTRYTYSPRGWVLSTSVEAGNSVLLTTYGYNGMGQLKSVALPNLRSLSYTYDDAQRLKLISDNLGNSVSYTLDALGNVTGETVSDPQGVLRGQISRVYDSLGFVQSETGGAQ